MTEREICERLAEGARIDSLATYGSDTYMDALNAAQKTSGASGRLTIDGAVPDGLLTKTVGLNGTVKYRGRTYELARLYAPCPPESETRPGAPSQRFIDLMGGTLPIEEGP